MKEHEDEVMLNVNSKSTVSVDVVSETLGGGEGKIEGVPSLKDQDEDVIVDVVGSDVVEEDVECMKGETEIRGRDMEDVVGSGGVRVLSSEKDGEEVEGLGEECKDSVESRGLTSENVVTVVSGSNGDIDGMGSKDVTEKGLTEEVMVESVAEVVDRKNMDSSVLTADLGLQEVDVVVEAVESRTDEADKMSKEDRVMKDDVQEMTDGDCAVSEKIEKDNEGLVSAKISEPLVALNPGSEDVDVVGVEEGLARKDEVQDDISVEPSLVGSEVAGSATGEDEIDVHDEKVEQHAEVEKLSEKESLHPTTEVITEVSVMVKNDAEGVLTENKEIMEQATELVQEMAYENGVVDEKTGKGDEIADSAKIPESLTTTNLGPEEVNGVKPIADTVEHPVLSCEDADMDVGEDAGMDIDEVLGWKDEVAEIDVTSGAEKEQQLNITANVEANVEQKLLGSSSEPVLIQQREEHSKSREPIVYGRRVHVEVPLYESLDVEQKLPESSSPVSEDENLKIETDSEDEEDDNDNESVQEDEQQIDRQGPGILENGNLFSLHQPCHFKPPENEGEFSVSDLVWGKVRSHPWWPGQIVDPSNASKKAMKYYKKDSFLVAYFGDHSFAWNNSSVLKPFRANFSQLEKQTDTEIFKTAVSCALEEVSRRVEIGLACSCIPKEICKKIEYQVIENSGVRKRSDKRHGIDESACVSSFEPDKLVDYIRLLAQFPGQGDELDHVIAKAQLSSYGHYKGYREPPEFWDCGDILEDDSVHENVELVSENGGKTENNLIESENPNKEISLSDITDDAPVSAGGNSKLASSSGMKKRKARVSISNGSVKKPNRPRNKVSTAAVSTPTATPKPSFKIGQLIQRVATQLTGPKVEHGQQAEQIVQSPENPQTESSVGEMLSQLHITAQDPMKEHGFFQKIIPFFYDRRAAVFTKSLKRPSTFEKPDSGMKSKASNENASGMKSQASNENDTVMKSKASNENEPEEFEFDFDFDDVNDSYWTDRIIQNHSEDQPLQEDQNGQVEEYPVAEYEPEKPAKRRRRSSKKQKRDVSSNPEPEPEVEEESELARKRRENLATEVILKFEEGINFCSEMQLNRMFRRFGPLMESETEVHRDGGRARVVFKRCFDAEVAHNSAGKFNIFGSTNVSYELNYSPLVSYKPLPLPLLQEDQMDVS